MIERTGDQQYDIGFDSQRFNILLAQKENPGFEARLAFEKAYTEQQLKTDIGERLDVSESTYFFDIREGKLFGDGQKIPFDQVIQSGLHRKEIDWEREEAELAGFRTIEAVMTDPQTPDGTIILNASPKGKEGSNYEKNYLDGFVKTGNRVKATRYLSSICNSHYRQRLVGLNPMYGDIFSEVPTDIELKSTPVVVPGYLNSDPKSVVMSVLGKETGMPSEKLEQIWLNSAPVWTSLINTLAETPDDIDKLEMMRRALYNASFKAISFEGDNQKDSPKFGRTNMEIIYLAGEPMKIGGGGCGGGKCSLNSLSNSESGGMKDKYGPINFSCPSCGETNTRPFNRLISHCQHCGSEKVLPKSVRVLKG